MSWDAVVVGAGLFGSVIAAALRAEGRRVVVIDDAQPEAGSRPAACLMKPSWFTSMGKDVHEPSLTLLDRLYGVSDLRFRVGPGHATVHWCDPATILSETPLVSRVVRVRPDGLCWELVLRDQNPITTDLVVVAAGIWTPLLVPVEGGLDGQVGIAFLWPGETIEDPFIRPWAPYRQLVAFNRGDGLWVGDGAAVRREKWTDARADQSEQRCRSAVSRMCAPHPQPLFGVRPYSRMKPCYLCEHAPGLWVATGGAKNGTVAAGWCAHEIVRRTS